MELAELTQDKEVARRIAFIMATVANKFGLPMQASPEILLQCAMEQPEAVTPDQFKLIYLMRSPEGLQ
jgi:hypothetical protein